MSWKLRENLGRRNHGNMKKIKGLRFFKRGCEREFSFTKMHIFRKILVSECHIWEPRKPLSSGWSSKKHGGKAGLTYELCTCIATGFMVWTNGPFPAGDWPKCDMKCNQHMRSVQSPVSFLRIFFASQLNPMSNPKYP
jgi:hypothetical protein